MTYEYAAYLRLLLLCGYREELDRHIDNALTMQNSLSDLTLALLNSRSDDKNTLSVLNAYLMDGNDTDIDYDNTVFDWILAFLQKKYQAKALSMTAVTELMHRIALYAERRNELWYSMYSMNGLYEETETGYLDKASFLQAFEQFLNHKVPIFETDSKNLS